MDDGWDVVVIGSGAAGLSAAVGAAECGARVVIFEAESVIGGSTALSSGVLMAGGSQVQRDLGIADSAEAFFRHYMDLNQWRLNPGLIRRFCTDAADAIDWLTGLGVIIPSRHSTNAQTPGIYRAGVEYPPRGHVPVGGGQGLVDTLDRARRRLSCELVRNTRIRRLLVDAGRVCGVEVDGVELRTSAVVVASGGFAQNMDLVREYFPQSRAAGESLFSVAAPGSRGDHFDFADQTGAALYGQGWGILTVTAYFQRGHHWEAGSPPASRLYVDQSGRRFMDEDSSYAVAGGILEDHGGSAWCVFDERARLALPNGFTGWDAERVRKEADAGRTAAGRSLRELAGKIEVSEDALEHTVKKWNMSIADGKDHDFHRHVSMGNKNADWAALDPIAEPPFYAVRMVPAELAHTHTGLEIDCDARVLSRTGEIVPGLFAAGEAAGGILGNRYVGGGVAVGSAVTMGWIAGKTSAKEAAA